MSSGAIRIALVGAESTGKTTLAAALAPRLQQASGLRAAWVPEVLRAWCDGVGRTPLAHEQPSIARAQHERIEAAAATHAIVVCDTTALMTAVYSRLVFGDRSLDDRAVALHRRMALTLLTAVDLPWVPDGQQRDGPHVRAPVDALLRELLLAHRLPWALVSGNGSARLDAAVAAVMPLLQTGGTPPRGGEATGVRNGGKTTGTPQEGKTTDKPRCGETTGRPRRGLFTQLDPRRPGQAARSWQCDCCAGG